MLARDHFKQRGALLKEVLRDVTLLFHKLRRFYQSRSALIYVIGRGAAPLYNVLEVIVGGFFASLGGLIKSLVESVRYQSFTVLIGA